MNLVKFTKNNFEDQVLKSDLPVLVDFWAVWCGPCRVVEPILEELSDELEGKVKIGKLNVDESQEIASEYDVQSIPTVIIFKKGEPVKRLVGIQPKEKYLQSLEG